MTLALDLQSGYRLIKEERAAITEELLREYESQLDTTSERTKKTYLGCIKNFISWLEINNIDVATRNDIVNYKKYLFNKLQLKDTTTNTYLTAIKDLYKYLETCGFTNIAKDIKKISIDNDFRKDNLTYSQVKSILSNIDKSTLEGKRANALFRLLIGTGLRECEVVRADIEDIKAKGNDLVLYVKGKGKSNKNNFVVICESVYNAIQDYLAARPNAKPNEPLFVGYGNKNNGNRLTTRTIQRIVKGLYAANGIVSDRITTHSTRHTAITLAADNGMEIEQVQAMARHKNINTTMIYYHNINRLNNAAENKLEELFKDI